MATEPLKRKLVTILATDAVGYSRHMATDEEGTMKILAAHRAVIDGIIQFHEGRILGTAGDSVLAEFASPVQAVRCAVEIQDALRTRNDSLPEERRLLFRIGINLGDVMVKGNDLLGDGVNVAARLESIAEPGGICISSSVYDQISGKLDLGFVDEGQQSLKNIDRPVHAYRVERGAASRRSPRRRAKPGGGLKWLAGGALAAALAAGTWQLVLVPLQEKARDAEAQAKLAAEERSRAEDLARKREEQLKQMAQAQAAAAAEAKQEAEEQAAAAARAKQAAEAQRAAAELAQARSEADRLRREAAAERAAAAEARRKADSRATAPPAQAPVATPAAAPAAAVAAAALKEGHWTATVSCPPGDGFPGRVLAMPLSVQSEGYVLEHGASNTPGSLALKGRQDTDGTLRFRGVGVSGMRAGSKPYPAGFQAKPVGDRYEGAGRLGRRECTLAIARAG